MASTPITTSKQYLSTHWYGHHPPLFSILFSLLGLRILIGTIPVPDSELIIFLFIVASILALIWQVVGTLRSGERHLKTTGDMMMLWAAYAGIIIASLLTVTQILDISADPPAITLESLRTEPLPELSEDKTTIYLKGEFGFPTNTDLLTLLEQNHTITTVELDSEGGLIYAARALAYSIKTHQLNTHVENRCNSACTLAFMAGEKRTLGSHGKIGFHQYKFEKKHPLRMEKEQDEQEKDLKYFASRGVSEQFLEQLYQSDHQNIWQPDRKTLFNAGILTQEQVTTSPYGKSD